MIPIKIGTSTRSRPYVTYALILANAIVFIAEIGANQGSITWKYGFIPAELIQSSGEFDAGIRENMRENPMVRPVVDRYGRPLVNPAGQQLVKPDIEAMKAAIADAEALSPWTNIITCMFVHGGWMHLLGNLLCLWIFAGSIEDRIGRVAFVFFYLLTGVMANLVHTYFAPGYTPLVGASGAISGTMGAYILLHPKARMLAVFPIGWYPMTVSLPAWAFLGIYFLIQNLYPAYFTIGDQSVAYWAHIGGFVSGAAIIYLFPTKPGPPIARPAYNPDDDDADLVI